jgi:small GTP-binding protein
MAKKKQQEQGQRASEEVQPELPPGVKLLRTLKGHQGEVRSVAFDAQGGMLASGSEDKTVKLWEVESGKLLRTLEGHWSSVLSVAFDPQGGTLASGSADKTVKLWEMRSGKLLYTLKEHGASLWSVAFDPQGGALAGGGHGETVTLWEVRSGKLLRTLEGHKPYVESIAFDPNGRALASGGDDYTVKLWSVTDGRLLHKLVGHKSPVASVAFDPTGRTLASGSEDKTVKLWEVESGKLLRTLEGHTALVAVIAFSPDGRLLASMGSDETILLWSCETWETIAVIPETTIEGTWIPALAFHPTLPLLAAAGSEPSTPEDERSRLIHLWELDLDVLLGQRAGVAGVSRAVHHTTGKIVLVGDHSVGKSALGYRLIHGEFKEQASTHGQQFWVFPDLGKRRADGTDCEAILWDFAGQPDYRLVHALFVDNADLALVLFDASDLHDPLHGVGFWLKQLQTGQSTCPIILVAAQTDRGSSTLTPEELSAFCQRNGIVGPIATSAFTGLGLAELIERMKSMIPWEEKAATVTTTTFKRIKDYVLGLKEAESGGQTIVTPEELRERLEATDADWNFTDAEMLTAVGHLENYGYVKRLQTSKGEQRILLQPERLNNLASSFVLEARRNPKGLGALEEKRLLAGGYDFPELKDLQESERDVLLDAAALLFLEHNVCFRETDPLRMEPYLVFPELINLKKPPEGEQATEDGVAYTVGGPTENVFASLVVLLGYTHTFTRTAQWQNNARYEMGDRLVCGFKQEAERDGELDFVLCFGPKVGPPVRVLFQGLFESFLARRNLTVLRYEPIRCMNVECGQLLDRSVVRPRLKEGKTFAFCNDCGEKLALPKMTEPIQLTREARAEVESQHRAAEQRTRFEQAVYRVRAYVAEQKITPPETFISYAWGVPEHERWVEKRLAADLQKAGIAVVLDRWENSRIGSSILRFVERIEECGHVIVIGTPLYRQKAKNVASAKGSVVAAEWDLAGIRLLAAEAQKQTVLPVLLAGEESESFPALLRGRVYGDFRVEDAYFAKAFDLILDVYDIPHSHPAVADLRESLRGPEMR